MNALSVRLQMPEIIHTFFIYSEMVCKSTSKILYADYNQNRDKLMVLI